MLSQTFTPSSPARVLHALSKELPTCGDSSYDMDDMIGNIHNFQPANVPSSVQRVHPCTYESSLSSSGPSPKFPTGFHNSRSPALDIPLQPNMFLQTPVRTRPSRYDDASNFQSNHFAYPDSPRPVLRRAPDILKARLSQLEVWGDAAKRHRTCAMDVVTTFPSTPYHTGNHLHPSSPNLKKQPVVTDIVSISADDTWSSTSSEQVPSVPVSPEAVKLPCKRRPDRPSSPTDVCAPPLARRRSFFCSRPSEAMSRKPSMWARFPSSNDQSSSPTPNAFRSSQLNRHTGPFGSRHATHAQLTPSDNSSFHASSCSANARTHPHPRTRPSSRSRNPSKFGDEFDDLIRGIHATKVTETQFRP